MDINLVNMWERFPEIKKEGAGIAWKGDFDKVFFYTDKKDWVMNNAATYENVDKDFEIECKKVCRIGKYLVVIV